MRPARTIVGLAWMIVFAGPTTGLAQTGDFLGRNASEWVKQLALKDAGQRRGAAFALGRIGADAELYLPRLLERALKDDNPGVRETAAMAVGDIVLSLEQRARDQVAKGDRLLGDVLAALEPPMQERVRNGEISISEATSLYVKRQSSRHWDAVGAALLARLDQEKDAGARRGLIYALGAFGSADKQVLPALLRALKDASPSVRRNAAWAVGRAGATGGKSAVRALTAMLGDAEPLVRRDAATALGDIGLPTAAPALKPLLDLVDRESKKETGDPVVFRTALDKIVALIGEGDQELADRLYPYLETDDSEITLTTAFALANLGGPRSQPAVKVLREALKSDDPQVQEQAVAALGHMKKEAASAVLDVAEALNARTVGVRRKAVVALAQLGPLAEPAVPQLARALQGVEETDPEVRRYAAEALYFINTPGNEKALPVLVEVIRKERDPMIKLMAIVVLLHIKDIKQNDAEKLLLALVNDDRAIDVHRREAARVLALHLGDSSPDKVGEVLLDMLRATNLQLYQGAEVRAGATGENQGATAVKENTGGDARFLAAEALGWMGRKANKPEIIRELEKTQQEKDEQLRQASTQALERIRAGFRRVR